MDDRDEGISQVSVMMALKPNKTKPKDVGTKHEITRLVFIILGGHNARDGARGNRVANLESRYVRLDIWATHATTQIGIN